MATFKPGDPVYVTDPGHNALRDFMQVAFKGEPDPIHHGIVKEVRDTGHVVVTFDDDGTSAPYSEDHVHHLPEKPGDIRDVIRQEARAAEDNPDAPIKPGTKITRPGRARRTDG